ncbi:hypothetical protein HJG60_008693 [Phyllostomus discolor]|uniref:Uncharacterized protein n=1 Tax=Phyllostomus discolor TaxID=89673 RepID=A0A834DLC7_9CHIR|nr:hypothetical protein HJG60_008693 [Phyllostomus discolor]
MISKRPLVTRADVIAAQTMTTCRLTCGDHLVLPGKLGEKAESPSRWEGSGRCPAAAGSRCPPQRTPALGCGFGEQTPRLKASGQQCGEFLRQCRGSGLGAERRQAAEGKPDRTTERTSPPSAPRWKNPGHR